MRDKGGGGGPKTPKICVTSFMDGPLEEQEGRDRRDGAQEPRDQRVADEVGRRLGEVGVLKLLGIVESSLFQIVHYKDQDS